MSNVINGVTLVTGAAGFIGSHVCEALLARGGRVVGVDSFDPYYDPAIKRRNLQVVSSGAPVGAFEFEELDLGSEVGVAELMAKVRPSTVIHLAAKAGVRPSIAAPVAWMHANVMVTQTLLSEAHKAGVARVVAASSSSVYGNCKVVPFREDADVSEPISPYAASKRACELLAFTHHHLHRQPVAMLRFFTVFGPRQRPDLAISMFMRKIHSGTPIDVYGDLGTARDYTYVADTVAGIIAAAEHVDRFGYRIWNLGNDHPVSLGEMIGAIGVTVGREAVMNRQPQRPGDVDRTWADLSRAKAELGYSPAMSFEAGLARQWRWLQGQ